VFRIALPSQHTGAVVEQALDLVAAGRRGDPLGAHRSPARPPDPERSAAWLPVPSRIVTACRCADADADNDPSTPQRGM